MRLMPAAMPHRAMPDAPAIAVVFAPAPATIIPEALCLGRFDSPAGPMIALGAEGELWALGFTAETGEDAVLADFAHRWPHTRFVEAPEALAPIIAILLRGQGEIRVHPSGTEFQTRVWRALVEIPSGHVISYGTLAERIGRPGAARAVGNAVGRNPIAWVIPCHRVIRESGEGGGYHWGVGIKRILQDLEQGPRLI